MVTYRFPMMDGRMYEVTINKTDNALPEIEKRIEYSLRKLEEKENRCEQERQSLNRTGIK